MLQVTDQPYALPYQQIMNQIQAACEQSNRQTVPTLIAVSKKQSVEAMRAFYGLGQRDFGENYLQEALLKQAEMSEADINWHFIGPIQRNKTRELAKSFQWVHTVDRLLIAERLSEQRPISLPSLNICLQVNIDNELTKSGCEITEASKLVSQISQLKNLSLRGLMVIPDKNKQDAFERTALLFEQLRKEHVNPELWDTLSMGMSGDFPEAIAAGATFIRVGTALFGARN